MRRYYRDSSQGDPNRAVLLEALDEMVGQSTVFVSRLSLTEPEDHYYRLALLRHCFGFAVLHTLPTIDETRAAIAAYVASMETKARR